MVVCDCNDYDPYGNPIVNTLTGTGRKSKIENPYGFTGEWWENDIDLLYLHARWYAPEMGTFLSVDPVEGEPAYQYVGGNVVNLIDASGKSPECQDECKPTVFFGAWSGWANLSRITCFDLKMHGDNMESYLKWEADTQPSTLLTRIAMVENNNDFSDRILIMWTVRMRMEIGFTTGWDPPEGQKHPSTTLSEIVFYPNAYDSITKMLTLKDPKNELLCGSHIKAGVYPCDDDNSQDDTNSDTLRQWAITHLKSRQILATTTNDIKNQYPEVLKRYQTSTSEFLYAYDSFLGKGSEPPYDYSQPYYDGNKYFAYYPQRSKWIWEDALGIR